ncbi:MAG: hypothetical protein ACRC6I_01920, partial [Paracoccaceae bacterium]
NSPRWGIASPSVTGRRRRRHMSVHKVRAKFWVKEIIHHHNGVSGASDHPVSVKLSPVYGNSDENKEWSKYTPSGEIMMMITNRSASDFFTLGAQVYVDFTSADAPLNDAG